MNLDASISIRWATSTFVRALSIGNLFETPLKEICEKYDADAHPICGPLLAGGPAALVTEYNLPHADRTTPTPVTCATKCGLC
ncbi:MAG: hypothetical protein MZV70_17920 [Desulfobacterales bacterium]|nr:hypothetical protein [Desulfobacterales bacterium]